MSLDLLSYAMIIVKRMQKDPEDLQARVQKVRAETPGELERNQGMAHMALHISRIPARRLKQKETLVWEHMVVLSLDYSRSLCILAERHEQGEPGCGIYGLSFGPGRGPDDARVLLEGRPLVAGRPLLRARWLLVPMTVLA